MKSRRLPILWRTVLLFVLLMAVLGPLGFLLFRYLWQTAEYRVEQRLNWGAASDLAAEIQPYLDPLVDATTVLQIVHRCLEANPRFDAYLVDDTGNILADYSTWDGWLQTTRIPIEPIERFLSPEAKRKLPIYGLDPRSEDSQESVISAAPIRIEGKRGYLYLILMNFHYNRIVQSSDLATALSAGAPMVALLILSCLSVGFICVYFLTKPLRNVAEVIREYERGDLSKRLNIVRRDEVGDIARAFNTMADSIARQIEDLQNKDRLRRELIADVAHDLRSPVAGVSCVAELLINEGKSMNEAGRQDYYATIQERTEALASLLAELFQLSKLEAQETRVNLQRCSIPQIFEDLSLSFSAQCQKKSITLETEYDESCPSVSADVPLVTRVITNLIENAIRYTPPGGAIHLRCRPVRDQVEIEVADTGSGIAPDDLPKIFDRKYQSPQQSDEAKGLSGLGLTIVRKILQAHGSDIEVRSAPGQGTAFSFRLWQASERTVETATAEQSGRG